MHKLFALLLLILFTWSTTLVGQTPWQYENDVRDYAYRSIDNPPVPGCTLFIGSSSFRLWKDLEKTFAEYEAVNRGFGGSKFSDNLRAIERIHLPANPSRVVIFCGTNDIAGGDDAEKVFNNFKFYIAQIWNEHPAAEIYFVVPTHAPVREKFWKTGDELFAKVQALAEKVPGLYCIDIRPAMLGEDGKVRENLFVKDRLHLNPDGYAIWGKVFKEVLDKQNKLRLPMPNLAELYQSRKAAGLFDDPRFAEQGIIIKDYSKPVKLNILFVGDNNPLVPTECVQYLQNSGYAVRKVEELKEEDKETELICSVMFYAEMMEPKSYRNKLKTSVDKLLTDYPKCKVVIHRPAAGYPLRLHAAFAEITTLVDYYSQTSAKGRVFRGDVNALRYFQSPPDVLMSSEKQADILGRFWGAAILRAVR